MKKYSEKALAKLKAIQDTYKNNPVTPLPTVNVRRVVVRPEVTPKTDIFGRPVGFVSPRVQRIRDIKAGKRGVQPLPRTMVWQEAPVRRTTVRPVQQNTLDKAGSVGQKTNESYEDWVKRMEATMDKAADYMESKK